MNRESYVNDQILRETHNTLGRIGYHFDPVKTGEVITELKSVNIADNLLDENLNYFREILPKGMMAMKVNGAIVIRMRTDLSWNRRFLSHYRQRLSEEKRPEAKAFLRQTIHGLKSAI